MGILLSIVSAIAWGLNSILLRWMQGEPAWQTLGSSVGNLMISALIFPWCAIRGISLKSVAVSFMSGLTWAIGMYLHISSIPLVGISRAVPICGGFQVICNSLLGWFVMGELPDSSVGRVTTIAGVVLIVVSMIFIVGRKEIIDTEEWFRRGLLLPVMAAMVFSLYIAPIRYFEIPGKIAALPQAVGMVTGSIGLMRLKRRRGVGVSPPHRKLPFRVICLPGLIWGIGNALLLLALPCIGISVSFALTRLSVVISSCFGVFYFREAQTGQTLSVLVAGILTILGSIAMSVANSL